MSYKDGKCKTRLRIVGIVQLHHAYYNIVSGLQVVAPNQKEHIMNAQELPNRQETRTVINKLFMFLEPALESQVNAAARPAGNILLGQEPNNHDFCWDFWVNSTAVTGIRCIRIRIYFGTQDAINATINHPRVREILKDLPAGSWKIYSRSYNYPWLGLTGLVHRNNIIKIYYRSRVYHQHQAKS